MKDVDELYGIEFTRDISAAVVKLHQVFEDPDDHNVIELRIETLADARQFARLISFLDASLVDFQTEAAGTPTPWRG